MGARERKVQPSSPTCSHPRTGVSVNNAILSQVEQNAISRTTRGFKGSFIDLAFYLRPGQLNHIQILFRNPVKDVVATAGIRIVFADGEEMVIKSGSFWQAEIEEEENASGKIYTKERYGGCNYGKAEIFTETSLAPAWFRKEIPVKAGLLRGRLYLSALGYGMPYINGAFAGDGLISPPQSDYEEMAYYTTHDITNFLKQGSNALSILLDAGWYHEVGGFGSNFSYGRPGLKAMIVLDYADGHTEWVFSGRDWKWKEGSILSANIYRGERIDYRKDHDEWKSMEENKGWANVMIQHPLSPKLIAMELEPIRSNRLIRPVKKWQTGPKTWLIDMGETIHGWVKLKVDEPGGARVYLRYSEYAENGKIWNVPLSHWWCHGVMQSDILTCDGKQRIFEPVFTPKSFRFVEVSGLSHEPGEDDITGVLVCSSAPSLSEFESSDPMLNKIYENGMRTFRNYMNHMFGDIPRERCLWGAESIYSWVPAFNCFDWAPYNIFMNDLWVKGRKAPGGIPGNIGVGLRLSNVTHDFTWTSTPLYLSYRIMNHYGDLDAIQDGWPVIRNLLHYFRKTAENGAIPQEHNHGDHAPPHDIPRVQSNKLLVAAMNFYNSEIQFAEISEQLGKKEASAESRYHSEIIRNEVMKFYDPVAHSFGNSTHNSLALAHGIIKDTAEEEALATSLVNIFRENEHKFDAGFMGYEIYPMLSRYGYGDDALKMLRNADYPGPAWSIEEYDATTFWEAYYYDKSFQMNRGLNFIAYAHPIGWLITDLAGIKADPYIPGGQKLIMSPTIPKTEKLDWVNASLHTMQGLVKSRWKLKGKELEWEITIPPNTLADLYIPVFKPGEIRVPAGFRSLGFKDGKEVYEAQPGTYVINSRIRK